MFSFLNPFRGKLNDCPAESSTIGQGFSKISARDYVVSLRSAIHRSSAHIGFEAEKKKLSDSLYEFERNLPFWEGVAKGFNGFCTHDPGCGIETGWLRHQVETQAWSQNSEMKRLHSMLPTCMRSFSKKKPTEMTSVFYVDRLPRDQVKSREGFVLDPNFLGDCVRLARPTSSCYVMIRVPDIPSGPLICSELVTFSNVGLNRHYYLYITSLLSSRTYEFLRGLSNSGWTVRMSEGWHSYVESKYGKINVSVTAVKQTYFTGMTSRAVDEVPDNYSHFDHISSCFSVETKSTSRKKEVSHKVLIEPIPSRVPDDVASGLSTPPKPLSPKKEKPLKVLSEPESSGALDNLVSSITAPTKPTSPKKEKSLKVLAEPKSRGAPCNLVSSVTVPITPTSHKKEDPPKAHKEPSTEAPRVPKSGKKPELTVVSTSFIKESILDCSDGLPEALRALLKATDSSLDHFIELFKSGKLSELFFTWFPNLKSYGLKESADLPAEFQSKTFSDEGGVYILKGENGEGRGFFYKGCFLAPFHVVGDNPVRFGDVMVRATEVDKLKDLVSFGGPIPDFQKPKAGTRVSVYLQDKQMEGLTLSNKPVHFRFPGSPIPGQSGSPIYTSDMRVVGIYSNHRIEDKSHVSLQSDADWRDTIITLMQEEGLVKSFVPCGNGKSTSLPIQTVKRCGPTVMVEPRTILPGGLATYLRTFGVKVAAASGDDDIDDDDCDLLILTHGKFLSALSKNQERFDRYNVILVDEAHDPTALTQASRTWVEEVWMLKPEKLANFMTGSPNDPDFALHGPSLSKHPITQVTTGKNSMNEREMSDFLNRSRAKLGDSCMVQIPSVSYGRKLAQILGNKKFEIHILSRSEIDKHGGSKYFEEILAAGSSGKCILFLATPAVNVGVTLSIDSIVLQGTTLEAGCEIGNASEIVPRILSIGEFIQWLGRVGRIKPGSAFYPNLKWGETTLPTSELLLFNVWMTALGLRSGWLSPEVTITKEQALTSLKLDMSINQALGMVTEYGALKCSNPALEPVIKKFNIPVNEEAIPARVYTVKGKPIIGPSTGLDPMNTDSLKDAKLSVQTGFLSVALFTSLSYALLRWLPSKTMIVDQYFVNILEKKKKLPKSKSPVRSAEAAIKVLPGTEPDDGKPLYDTVSTSSDLGWLRAAISFRGISITHPLGHSKQAYNAAYYLHGKGAEGDFDLYGVDGLLPSERFTSSTSGLTDAGEVILDRRFPSANPLRSKIVATVLPTVAGLCFGAFGMFLVPLLCFIRFGNHRSELLKKVKKFIGGSDVIYDIRDFKNSTLSSLIPTVSTAIVANEFGIPCAAAFATLRNFISKREPKLPLTLLGHRFDITVPTSSLLPPWIMTMPIANVDLSSIAVGLRRFSATMFKYGPILNGKVSLLNIPGKIKVLCEALGVIKPATYLGVSMTVWSSYAPLVVGTIVFTLFPVFPLWTFVMPVGALCIALYGLISATLFYVELGFWCLTCLLFRCAVSDLINMHQKGEFSSFTEVEKDIVLLKGCIKRRVGMFKKLAVTIDGVFSRSKVNSLLQEPLAESQEVTVNEVGDRLEVLVQTSSMPKSVSLIWSLVWNNLHDKLCSIGALRGAAMVAQFVLAFYFRLPLSLPVVSLAAAAAWLSEYVINGKPFVRMVFSMMMLSRCTSVTGMVRAFASLIPMIDSQWEFGFQALAKMVALELLFSGDVLVLVGAAAVYYALTLIPQAGFHVSVLSALLGMMNQSSVALSLSILGADKYAKFLKLSSLDDVAEGIDVSHSWLTRTSFLIPEHASDRIHERVHGLSMVSLLASALGLVAGENLRTGLLITGLLGNLVSVVVNKNVIWGSISADKVRALFQNMILDYSFVCSLVACLLGLFSKHLSCVALILTCGILLLSVAMLSLYRSDSSHSMWMGGPVPEEIEVNLHPEYSSDEERDALFASVDGSIRTSSEVASEFNQPVRALVSLCVITFLLGFPVPFIGLLTPTLIFLFTEIYSRVRGAKRRAWYLRRYEEESMRSRLNEAISWMRKLTKLVGYPVTASTYLGKRDPVYEEEIFNDETKVSFESFLTRRAVRFHCSLWLVVITASAVQGSLLRSMILMFDALASLYLHFVVCYDQEARDQACKVSFDRRWNYSIVLHHQSKRALMEVYRGKISTDLFFAQQGRPPRKFYKAQTPAELESMIVTSLITGEVILSESKAMEEIILSDYDLKGLKQKMQTMAEQARSELPDPEVKYEFDIDDEVLAQLAGASSKPVGACDEAVVHNFNDDNESEVSIPNEGKQPEGELLESPTPVSDLSENSIQPGVEVSVVSEKKDSLVTWPFVKADFIKVNLLGEYFSVRDERIANARDRVRARWSSSSSSSQPSATSTIKTSHFNFGPWEPVQRLLGPWVRTAPVVVPGLIKNVRRLARNRKKIGSGWRMLNVLFRANWMRIPVAVLVCCVSYFVHPIALALSSVQFISLVAGYAVFGSRFVNRTADVFDKSLSKLASHDIYLDQEIVRDNRVIPEMILPKFNSDEIMVIGVAGEKEWLAKALGLYWRTLVRKPTLGLLLIVDKKNKTYLDRVGVNFGEVKWFEMAIGSPSEMRSARMVPMFFGDPSKRYFHRDADWEITPLEYSAWNLPGNLSINPLGLSPVKCMLAAVNYTGGAFESFKYDWYQTKSYWSLYGHDERVANSMAWDLVTNRCTPIEQRIWRNGAIPVKFDHDYWIYAPTEYLACSGEETPTKWQRKKASSYGDGPWEGALHLVCSSAETFCGKFSGAEVVKTAYVEAWWTTLLYSAMHMSVFLDRILSKAVFQRAMASLRMTQRTSVQVVSAVSGLFVTLIMRAHKCLGAEGVAQCVFNEDHLVGANWPAWIAGRKSRGVDGFLRIPSDYRQLKEFTQILAFFSSPVGATAGWMMNKIANLGNPSTSVAAGVMVFRGNPLSFLVGCLFFYSLVNPLSDETMVLGDVAGVLSGVVKTGAIEWWAWDPTPVLRAEYTPSFVGKGLTETRNCLASKRITPASSLGWGGNENDCVLPPGMINLRCSSILALSQYGFLDPRNMESPLIIGSGIGGLAQGLIHERIGKLLTLVSIPEVGFDLSETVKLWASDAGTSLSMVEGDFRYLELGEFSDAFLDIAATPSDEVWTERDLWERQNEYERDCLIEAVQHISRGGNLTVTIGNDQVSRVLEAAEYLALWFKEVKIVEDPLTRGPGLCWIVAKKFRGTNELYHSVFPGEFSDSNECPMKKLTIIESCGETSAQFFNFKPMSQQFWQRRVFQVFKNRFVEGLETSPNFNKLWDTSYLHPDNLEFISDVPIEYENTFPEALPRGKLISTKLRNSNGAFLVQGQTQRLPVQDREFNAGVDLVNHSILSQAGVLPLEKNFNVPSQSNFFVWNGLFHRYAFERKQFQPESLESCFESLKKYIQSKACSFDFTPPSWDELREEANKRSSMGYMSKSEAKNVGDVLKNYQDDLDQTYVNLTMGGRVNLGFHASPKIEKKDLTGKSDEAIPRLFLYKEGLVRVAEMRLFKRVNDFFGSAGGLSFSMKGDAFTKAENMVNQFKKFNKPRGIQIESAKFDGHKELDLFIFARRIITAALEAGVSKQEQIDVLKSTAETDGVGWIYTCSGHLVTLLRGAQKSGLWDTSVNNKLGNLMVAMKLVCVALKIEPGDIDGRVAILIEGDDGMIIAEEEDAKLILAKRNEVYGYYGLPQVGDSELIAHPEVSDFCSHGATELYPGICVPVRDLNIIFGRLLVPCANSLFSLDMSMASRSLTSTISLVATYWYVPEVRHIWDIVRAVIPKNVIPAAVANVDKWKFHYNLGDLDPTSFDIDEYLIERFGWNPTGITMNAEARKRLKVDQFSSILKVKKEEVLESMRGIALNETPTGDLALWYSRDLTNEEVVSDLNWTEQSGIVPQVFCEWPGQLRSLYLNGFKIPAGSQFGSVVSSLARCRSKVMTLVYPSDKPSLLPLHMRMLTRSKIKNSGFRGSKVNFCTLGREGFQVLNTVRTSNPFSWFFPRFRMSSNLKKTSVYLSKGLRLTSRNTSVSLGPKQAREEIMGNGVPEASREMGIEDFLARRNLGEKIDHVSVDRNTSLRTLSHLCTVTRRFGVFNFGQSGKLRSFLVYVKEPLYNMEKSAIELDPSLFDSDKLMKRRDWRFNGSMLTVEEWRGEMSYGQIERPVELFRDMQGTLRNVTLFLRVSDCPELRIDGDHANKYLFKNTKVGKLSKYGLLLGESSDDQFVDIPKPYDAEILGAVNVAVPWESKLDAAVFRGGLTGAGSDQVSNPRLMLVENEDKIAFNSGVSCDFGLTSYNNRIRIDLCGRSSRIQSGPTKEKLSYEQMAHFKYNVVCEGNEAPDRVLRVLATGSIMIYLEPTFCLGKKGWMDPLLIDGYNCIRCDPSDEAVVEALRRARRLGKAIGAEGKKLASKLLSHESRVCYLNNLVANVIENKPFARKSIAEVVQWSTERRGQHSLIFRDKTYGFLHGSCVNLDSQVHERSLEGVDLGGGVSVFQATAKTILEFNRNSELILMDAKLHDGLDHLTETEVGELRRMTNHWQEVGESMGTLGSGNHFIEVVDNGMDLRLVVHAGCRLATNYLGGNIQTARNCEKIAELNRRVLARMMGCENVISSQNHNFILSPARAVKYGLTGNWLVKDMCLGGSEVILMGSPGTGCAYLSSSPELVPHGLGGKGSRFKNLQGIYWKKWYKTVCHVSSSIRRNVRSNLPKRALRTGVAGVTSPRKGG